MIDQTLYWLVVDTEDEARYLTGLFNSPAIDPLVTAFQPQGQRKERHIHSLPKLVTPPFDSSDPLHQEVVERTSTLLDEWQVEGEGERSSREAGSQQGPASRRTFLRRQISRLSAYRDFAEVCRALYDATAD